MNENQWKSFCKYKDELKTVCAQWKSAYEARLFPLIKDAWNGENPAYPLENAFVYNTAYDSIQQEDDIKLIVIGDNPGKDEQLNKNQKYLVGQAGKIAEGFFRRNPGLEIDFRKNVIIANKTPMHSAKTAQLKRIVKAGGSEIEKLLNDSQKKMAEITAELHRDLIRYGEEGKRPAEIWLVGYSELKPKGIFGLYMNELKARYDEGKSSDWQQVKVYQHFSMNCFTKNLKSYQENAGTYVTDGTSEGTNCGTDGTAGLIQALENIGNSHRQEIFGC